MEKKAKNCKRCGGSFVPKRNGSYCRDCLLFFTLRNVDRAIERGNMRPRKYRDFGSRENTHETKFGTGH